MRNSKFDVVARWGWLVLLAIIFLLFGRLRSLRHETLLARATAEALTKQLEVRQDFAETATNSPATISSSQPANKPATPPGALTFFHDGNALGDAEYGAIIARRYRQYAMGNHRQAIDAMSLSPADKERLKELLAAKTIALEDASDIVQRMGDAPPGLREKARELAQAEAQQKITALLGDEGYAKFQATYDQFSTTKMNWGLATDFWDAGIPLTTDQQMAFARAQQQVRSQYPRQENPLPTDPRTGLTEADQKLLEAVSSFLSHEQVAFTREDRIAEANYLKAVRDKNERKRSAAAKGK